MNRTNTHIGSQRQSPTRNAFQNTRATKNQIQPQQYQCSPTSVQINIIATKIRSIGLNQTEKLEILNIYTWHRSNYAPIDLNIDKMIKHQAKSSNFEETCPTRIKIIRNGQKYAKFKQNINIQRNLPNTHINIIRNGEKYADAVFLIEIISFCILKNRWNRLVATKAVWSLLRQFGRY